MRRWGVLGSMAAFALLVSQGHAATNSDPRWAELLRLNRSLICPEALPSQAAREAALETFADTVTQVYGPITSVSRLVSLRTRMLKVHKCTRALANTGAE